ncbi:MAG: hypothetical protein JWN25_925 [Verrucomicrobiales bacterium]|nr:hypothetical protein [Verrucomicrobiales bacterium]
MNILTYPWKVEFGSPRAFLIFSVIASLLYFGSRIAGLEEFTTFLSGTNPSHELSWRTACMLGEIHLFLHFTFILLVPISLITAGLIAIWNRRTSELQSK